MLRAPRYADLPYDAGVVVLVVNELCLCGFVGCTKAFEGSFGDSRFVYVWVNRVVTCFSVVE